MKEIAMRPKRLCMLALTSALCPHALAQIGTAD